ncbi:MAG TPA: helix-turn-helix domain-containing protein [Verrucomicrobiota bacterium]|nr:helix-turn-helix domain-containing protein [Verrucomicrobiota bacterium]
MSEHHGKDAYGMVDKEVRKLVPITGSRPVVSDFLGGIGRTKIYKLIDSGQLARVNIGRRAFVTAESIENFIDRITGDAVENGVGTSEEAPLLQSSYDSAREQQVGSPVRQWPMP